MNNCIPLISIPLQATGVCTFIKQGDTLAAYEIDIIVAGLDLTTSTIKMQLYHNNSKVMDISNGNGITVLSATTLQIDNVPAISLPIGTSTGDLEVTDATGIKTTFFNIEYVVSKQYTK